MNATNYKHTLTAVLDIKLIDNQLAPAFCPRHPHLHHRRQNVQSNQPHKNLDITV